MSRLIHIDDENQSKLWKVSDDEAIDLRTGDKYELRKKSNESSFGAGLMVGVSLAMVLLTLLSGNQPTASISDPVYAPASSQNYLP